MSEDNRPFALRLARHRARNPLALEHLTCEPAAEHLTCRSAKADGPTAGTRTLDPPLFLARLITHFPDPGQVMTRCCGWTDLPTDCEYLLDYEIAEEEYADRKKPWRHRWPDAVRDEVLARLLELNAARARAGPGGRPSRDRADSGRPARPPPEGCCGRQAGAA